MSALRCPTPEFDHSDPKQPPATRMGRPRTCTPGLITAIAAFIQIEGLSDSAAGLRAGVSTSTLSRWRQEDEEVAMALGQARALYELERSRLIRQACLRDGRLDWQAQVWLLQFSSPETYGAPSRRRLTRMNREVREAMLDKRNTESADPQEAAHPSGAIAGQELAAKWASPAPDAADASVTILPESHHSTCTSHHLAVSPSPPCSPCAINAHLTAKSGEHGARHSQGAATEQVPLSCESVTILPRSPVSAEEIHLSAVSPHPPCAIYPPHLEVASGEQGARHPQGAATEQGALSHDSVTILPESLVSINSIHALAAPSSPPGPAGPLSEPPSFGCSR